MGPRLGDLHRIGEVTASEQASRVATRLNGWWWDQQVVRALRTLTGEELRDRLDHLVRLAEAEEGKK